MNKVFLIGNITRDPELAETSSGVKVCRFSIAVNRNYVGPDGERKTDFFNVTAWRGLGETVAKFVKKGNKLAVVGSLEIRNYEDSQNIKRISVDVVATDIDFLTPKSNSGNSQKSETATETETHGGVQLQSFDDDSDIPF